MNQKKQVAQQGAMWGAIAALTCAAAALGGGGQGKNGPNDLATNARPSPGRPIIFDDRPHGNMGGGIADVVLYDNGAIATGEAHACAVPGTRSTLQNVAPICLNILGFGLAAPGLFIADDFDLTDCTRIRHVTVYGYLTNAAAVTATGATITLHSGRPFCPTSNVIATTTGTVAGGTAVASFTTTYRSIPADVPPGTGCARRIQQIVIDTNSFPQLPPGHYWISWQISGVSFCPPVTVLGLQGKPGANSMQSNGGAFAVLTDVGSAACPIAPGAPQDMPFLLEGTHGPCPECPADIDGNGTVNVNDLLAVITHWGACPPPCPPFCIGDIDHNCVVNVNDLLTVITSWGACPPGPPPVPPAATGACCTGAACAIVTFNACLTGGGNYFGDGSTCAQASGCVAPANDECLGATALADGPNGTFTQNATNSADAAPSCAAISHDVWYTLATVAGTSYTVDTATNAPSVCTRVGDTVIQVLAGCGGAEIACNDDISATNGLSTVTFLGTGAPVIVRVGTFGATGLGGQVVTTVTHTP